MIKVMQNLGRASLLALAVAGIYLGHQELLRHRPYGSPGAWLIVLAGVLTAVWTLRPVPQKRPPQPKSKPILLSSIIFGALGLVWALAGAVLFQKEGMELVCLVSWVSAVFCFLAARWRPLAHYQAETASPSAESYFLPPCVRVALLLLFIFLSILAVKVNLGTHHLGAAILWAVSVVGMTLIWLPRRLRGHKRRSQSTVRNTGRLEWAAFLLILIMAAAIRFVAVDTIPGHIEPDEGRQGRHGAEILGRPRIDIYATTKYPTEWERKPFRIWGRGFPDLFGVGWNSFPNIGYSIQALAFQLGGVSLGSARRCSAFVGTLALIPFFFWFRRWWGWWAGLIATILFAFNGYSIGWSRIGLNPIHGVLTTALVLWAVTRAYQTNRMIDYALAGITLGFTFHVYSAAKVAVIATGVFWFMLMLLQKSFLRRSLPGLTLCLIVTAATVGPTWVTNYTNESISAAQESRFRGDDIVRCLTDADEADRRPFLAEQIMGPLCLLTVLNPGNGWA